MENKQSTMMKSIDQRPRSTRGCSDLLARRQKSRERQRRYRARKRLETEIPNSFVVEQTAEVQVALQSNGNRNNFVTRIYCNRDWKKDARRAHFAKRHEMNGSTDHSPALINVLEATFLAVGNKSEKVLDRKIRSDSTGVVYNETPRTVLCRRDWKAEARRKKN